MFAILILIAPSSVSAVIFLKNRLLHKLLYLSVLYYLQFHIPFPNNCNDKISKNRFGVSQSSVL